MNTSVIIIKRDKVTFYIKEETITVSSNDFQYTSYNVYSLQNRAPFNEFKEKILNSKPPEYSHIIDVVELGVRCGIYGNGTVKPNLEGLDCEYRP